MLSLSSRVEGTDDPISADELSACLHKLGALDDATTVVAGRALQAGIDDPQPGVKVRFVAVDADGKTVFGATETTASGIIGVELIRSRAQCERERHNLVLPISRSEPPARIAQLFHQIGTETTQHRRHPCWPLHPPSNPTTAAHESGTLMRRIALS